MKLTTEQLHIQKRAKKDLTFGCLVKQRGIIEVIASLDREAVDNGDMTFAYIDADRDVIGHPMNRGRLCYLYESDTGEGTETGEAMRDYAMFKHREILQQTVLERSPDFQKLVIAFLESLPDNTTTEGA